MPTITAIFDLTDSDFASLNKYLAERKWEINDYIKTLVAEHQIALLEGQKNESNEVSEMNEVAHCKQAIGYLCNQLEKHEEVIFKLESQIQQIKTEIDKRNSNAIWTP